MKIKSPTTVARYINALADADNEFINPMKIEKLVYYCHGWHLAIYDAPLLNEVINAKYGVSITSLHNNIKHFGNEAIESSIFKERFLENYDNTEKLEGYQKKLVGTVWDRYGFYTAIQLSNASHSAESPYRQLEERYSYDIPKGLNISDDLIKEYFLKLANYNKNKQNESKG